MADDILVSVEHVSKKFCRSLKRSLWYGLCDIAAELGSDRQTERGCRLRPREFPALDGVTVTLRRGECLGLIGRNGAGKSTLLKMLNGLIKPDAGRIALRGRVGAIIELNAGFNPLLTGRENIYIYGSILGFSRQEIQRKFDTIVAFAEIADFLDAPLRTYSSGMKVRLGFAVAAQLEPDILLIDEVLAVGDVGFRNKCYNAIYQMCRQAAVIFVSHNMNHIDRLCSRALLLDQGRSASETDTVARVIDAYHRVCEDTTPARTTTLPGVCLDNLQINGAPPADTHQLRHGDSLTVAADLQVPAHYRELEVSLSLLSHALEMIAHANSRADGCRIAGPAVRLTIELPDLQLGCGIYYLSLMVRDPHSNEVLCWHYACARLQVSADVFLPAPYAPQAVWHTEN